MNSLKRHHESGEALIEAIIALAVVVAISTGIVTAIISAVSGTNSNENSSDALNLAQEGMNTVKNNASQDFSTFEYLNGTYCLDIYETIKAVAYCPAGYTNISLSSSNTNKVENYRRIFYVNQNGNAPGGVNKCGNNGAYVAMIVQWADSACKSGVQNCHETEIDSCITNTDALPAP